MVDTNSTAGTNLLLQYMQQRRDILYALRLLTDSQTQAARSADVNVTLGILSRKESLISELTALLQLLQPFHADDPDQRQWSSAEARAQCRRLAEEGDRLLEETVRIEESTLAEVTSQRDALAAQLQNGKDSILAHNAYTAGVTLNESSLDLSNL